MKKIGPKKVWSTKSRSEKALGPKFFCISVFSSLDKTKLVGGKKCCKKICPKKMLVRVWGGLNFLQNILVVKVWQNFVSFFCVSSISVKIRFLGSLEVP